ncbi:hypothetical protein ACIRU8_00740 [Streptomyces sp. NPDC101175]|uniref:hypothetical protein n=1 Tax=Streptomyces sp. NPDC101175 TaxID=3366123 RepID=UPI003833E2D7
MDERIDGPIRRVGLTALALAVSAVVCLGAEVGVGILLHVTQNVWLALLLYPLLYVLALGVLLTMVPSMEKPEGWGLLAMIVMPIGALAVTHLTYSGLDQQALHDRGREVRATVSDTYWVDEGPSAPLSAARFKDPSGRPVPGTIYGEKLRVGQAVTLTVDPKEKVPLFMGRRPTGSGRFLAAGITAAVESLFLGWAAFRGTAERLASRTTDERERERTQEREDSPA